MFSKYLQLKQDTQKEPEHISTQLAARVPAIAVALADASYWMINPRGWLLPKLIEQIAMDGSFMIEFRNPRAYGAKNFAELKQILDALAEAWSDALTMKIEEKLQQPDYEMDAQVPTFDEDPDEEETPPYRPLIGYYVTFTFADSAKILEAA